MNDHELTVLVEAAAEGAVNSQAASHGTTGWAELDGGMKNQVRERALPFIFHGMKTLHDLGYSKPRVIETIEELDQCVQQSFEQGETLVVKDTWRPWIIWEDDDGNAHVSSLPMEDDPKRLTLAEVRLPLTILHVGTKP